MNSYVSETSLNRLTAEQIAEAEAERLRVVALSRALAAESLDSYALAAVALVERCAGDVNAQRMAAEVAHQCRRVGLALALPDALTIASTILDRPLRARSQ